MLHELRESQLAASWSLSERALQSHDAEEQLQRDGTGAGMSSAALQGCDCMHHSWCEKCGFRKLKMHNN